MTAPFSAHLPHAPSPISLNFHHSHTGAPSMSFNFHHSRARPSSISVNFHHSQRTPRSLSLPSPSSSSYLIVSHLHQTLSYPTLSCFAVSHFIFPHLIISSLHRPSLSSSVSQSCLVLFCLGCCILSFAFCLWSWSLSLPLSVPFVSSYLSVKDSYLYNISSSSLSHLIISMIIANLIISYFIASHLS